MTGFLSNQIMKIIGRFFNKYYYSKIIKLIA